MSDHGPDIRESFSPMKVSLDTEDKRKDIDDYRVACSLLKLIILPADIQIFKEAKSAFYIQNSYDSLLRAEDETKSLRDRVKLLESKLTKTEARMLGEREVGKARAEAVRVEAVQAFRISKEFRNIKADFASLSYL
ncbi:hypothetical protein COCNU_02G001250 [Cocos nucifera]|uniref:Uncharacterized protein n=1 Tax=Cocos nucifera TaxID=13894 RepID=A0A8K0MW95_COCNU|nr:hypothetical protein COCNU_02G001250 [Cocos nucifera]